MSTGDWNYYCEMCKQLYYNAHGCPIHGQQYPSKVFSTIEPPRVVRIGEFGMITKIALQLRGMTVPVVLEVVKIEYTAYQLIDRMENGYGLGFVTLRQPDEAEDMTIEIEFIESLEIVLDSESE